MFKSLTIWPVPATNRGVTSLVLPRYLYRNWVKVDSSKHQQLSCKEVSASASSPRGKEFCVQNSGAFKGHSYIHFFPCMIMHTSLAFHFEFQGCSLSLLNLLVSLSSGSRRLKAEHMSHFKLIVELSLNKARMYDFESPFTFVSYCVKNI